MASIFDMFGGSPQSQGLLAAAAQILQASGPSRTPTGLGQILGGGLSAYQQQEQQARQLGQIEQMRSLQLQEGQAGLADRQRARDQEQQINDALRGAIGDNGLDTNAAFQGLARIDPRFALDFKRKNTPAADEYDTTPQVVNGPDGKPMLVQLSKTGAPRVLDGLSPREKLQLENLGGRSVAVNPYELQAGQAFQRTASPDAQLSAATQRRGQDITMRGQNMADARAVTSNPANKPLPAGALKMQQTELDALATASGIDGQLERIQGQLDGGKLSFGPVSNLVNQARNAAGMSSEESRNLASFRSTLEKLRNDSLRLNAGVQTDGDAQRAWNELFTNLNDTQLVQQRLGEIRGINQRAAQLRKLNVDGIRANYGHEPLDTSQYEQPTAAQQQQQPRQAAAGGKVATLSDIAATARASGRSTAEVTAALRAKGYTIGGQ